MGQYFGIDTKLLPISSDKNGICPCHLVDIMIDVLENFNRRGMQLTHERRYASARSCFEC